MTTGGNNTAVGYNALSSVSSAGINTAVGYLAMEDTTTGGYNVAVGNHALYQNTAGDNAVAIGNSAMAWTTDAGSSNSAVGSTALANVTGDANVAFGTNAGRDITSGSYNTVIGAEADVIETATNQTVIGYGATGQANNSVVLGNANVTAVYMAQDSGAHLYAGDATFGGDVTISSDSRLKSNIVSLGATLSKLLLIDGKSYIMNNSGKEKIGILAQDVQKVFPELVSEDANEMLSVNYQGLVPVLINAIKEQEDKIIDQQTQIDELKELVNQLID